MPTMFSPSTQTSPASGRSRPMMFLRSTDLPVPDGPMMALIFPFGRSNVMFSRTVCEPKLFVTPRSEMMASSANPLSPEGDSIALDVQGRGRFARFARGVAAKPELPECGADGEDRRDVHEGLGADGAGPNGAQPLVVGGQRVGHAAARCVE